MKVPSNQKRNLLKIIEIVFLVLLFIQIACFILYEGYIGEVGTSPDSSAYLREAKALLSGNGFHYCYMRGDLDSMFTSWPIGYPVLIAITAWVTNTDVFLASKILSIVLCALFMATVIARYRRHSWLYTLVLINLGFLMILRFTWSEVPFTLFMLWFALMLSDILQNEKPKVFQYTLLLLLSVGLLLIRTIGAFSFVCSGLFCLYYGIKYLKNRNKKKDLSKAVGLLIVCLLSFFTFILYRIVLQKLSGVDASDTMMSSGWLDLTIDLLVALKREIYNLFSQLTVMIYSIVRFNSILGLIIVGIFTVGIIAYVFRKRKKGIKVIPQISLFTDNTDCVSLLVTALTYMGCLIAYRYMFEFTTFQYRYFAPSSMLITLAIIHWLSCSKNTIAFQLLVPVGIVTYLSFAYTYGMDVYKVIHHDKVAYKTLLTELNQKYEVLPEDANVVFFDYSVEYDVALTYETRSFYELFPQRHNPEMYTSLEALKEKLSQKPVFYINYEELKEYCETDSDEEWKDFYVMIYEAADETKLIGDFVEVSSKTWEPVYE